MPVEIKFVNFYDVAEEYYPVPAKNLLPEWYKKSFGHVGNKKLLYSTAQDGGSSTIKKCLPVFDALTAGYILLSHEDVVVSDAPDASGAVWWYWTNNSVPMINFHGPQQAQLHPRKPDQLIPKFNNNWGIVTPPGYSCLIMSPMHRESMFLLYEAVVDTDTYAGRVHFTFSLKDPNWRGLIPAGTPIAQVIPFKRENYKMEISNEEADIGAIEKATKRLKSVFVNGYKDKFWVRKEYN
jgi:hypothetical protein